MKNQAALSSAPALLFLRTMALVLTGVVLWGCAAKPPPSTPSFTPPAHIMLLGEVHDNPDGHRQRYAYLRQLVEQGWRPAIVMEQFDRENQSQLTQAQAECDNAQCIVRMAGGGPRWEWEHYQPIIELALRYHLPLVAGNLSRTDAGQVVRKGLPAALDAASMEAFQLNRPLPTDLVEGQRLAIDEGHCGKLPASMVTGMVNAQVARDVWMAKALNEHAGVQGAVLIAGNGHVRKDIGVARWLPTVSFPSIQVHAYLEKESASAASEAPYDFVHAIDGHQRPDPCESIKTR